MELQLNDAVAVITGAGSGIGRSIALAFASQGTQIVVADIDQDAAERVAAEIAERGVTAVAAQVDVARLESVQDLADFAFSRFGRVDILCNNAGVTMRPFRAAWIASIRDYEWVMGINYFGVVHGILAFVPRMRQQPGRKHLVNTSSFAVLDLSPSNGAYAASKAAVTSLSDALREELYEYGDDFGVTVLYPGSVRTSIATSERLRPVDERSVTRRVEEYLPARTEHDWTIPIDPDEIGPLVVEAVRSNAPTTLTHAPPIDLLRARLASIEAGYLGRDRE